MAVGEYHALHARRPSEPLLPLCLAACKLQESLSRKGKSATPTLAASFRAVRRDVCEHVQLLNREDLKAFLAALASKGSSRRGATSGHLLRVEAMAARSPAVLWSFAYAFGGDVEGGVEELKAEGVAAE